MANDDQDFNFTTTDYTGLAPSIQNSTGPTAGMEERTDLPLWSSYNEKTGKYDRGALSKYLGDAWRQQALTGLSVASSYAGQEAVDEYLQKLNAAGIKHDIVNPFDMNVTMRHAFEQAYGGAAQDDPFNIFYRKRQELYEQYKDDKDYRKAAAVDTTKSIQDRSYELAREAQERTAKSLEAIRNTYGHGAESLAGGLEMAQGFVGGLRDPLSLPAFAAGPYGHMGLRAGSWIYQAGKAAVAGGVATATAQPWVQDWRRRAGMEYGWGEAGAEIAQGAIGMAIFDVGGRALYRGIHTIVGYKPVLVPGSMFGKFGGPKDELVVGWKKLEPSEYGDYPGGYTTITDDGTANGKVIGFRPAPTPGAPPPRPRPENTDQAADRLDLEAAKMPPTATAAKAQAGDPAALKNLSKAIGKEDDPAHRGAQQAAEIEHAIVETKDTQHIDPVEGTAKLSQAIASSLEPSESPPTASTIVSPAPPKTKAGKPGSVMQALAQDRETGGAREPGPRTDRYTGKTWYARRVPAKEVTTEPGTFQWRSGTTKRGVVTKGGLNDITVWDDRAAGRVMVYERAKPAGAAAPKLKTGDKVFINAADGTRQFKEPVEITTFQSKDGQQFIGFNNPDTGHVSFWPAEHVEKELSLEEKMRAGLKGMGAETHGEYVIAEGHQRLGLAQRLMNRGHEPIHLDADVFREADGWTPQEVEMLATALNIRQNHASAPVMDVARALRRYPQILDGTMPLSEGNLRMANSLASLSDEAFAKVDQPDSLPANWAAAVADTVADKSKQAGIIDGIVDIIKRMRAEGDTTPINTGMIHWMANFLQNPEDHIVLNRLLGGGGQEALLPSIAKALDALQKLLKSDKKLFSTLVTEAERILQVGGNELAGDANVRQAMLADFFNAMVEERASIPGPIRDLIEDAAIAIEEGTRPKEAAKQIVDGMTRIVEDRGIEGLRPYPPEELHGGGFDDPVGPEAKAQTEALEQANADRLAHDERNFAGTRLKQWLDLQERNDRPVPELNPLERAEVVRRVVEEKMTIPEAIAEARKAVDEMESERAALLRAANEVLAEQAADEVEVRNLIDSLNEAIGGLTEKAHLWAPDELEAHMQQLEDARDKLIDRLPPTHEQAPPLMAAAEAVQLGRGPGDLDPAGFFSRGDRAVAEMMVDPNAQKQARFGESFLKRLAERGVTPLEMKVRGLDQFLAGKKDVTLAEVRQHLKDNPVTIEETVMRGSPQKDRPLFDEETNEVIPGPTKYSRWSLFPDAEDQVEIVLRLGQPNKTGTYSDPHWGAVGKDAILHIRGFHAQDAQGRRWFIIQEIQSGWGQKLRDQAEKGLNQAEIDHAQAGMERARERLLTRSREMTQEFDRLAAAHGWDNYVPRNEGSNGRGLTADEVIGERIGEFYDAYKKATTRSMNEQMTDARRDEIGRLEDLRPHVDKINEEADKLGEDFRLLEAEYRDKAYDAVPSNPIIAETQTWLEIALKRAMREAIEHDADGIAIVPSEDPVHWFSISHVGDYATIAHNPKKPGRFWVGTEHTIHDSMSRAEAERYLGREAIEAYLASDEYQQNLDPTSTAEYKHNYDEPRELNQPGIDAFKATYDQMYPDKLGAMLGKYDQAVKRAPVDIPYAHGPEGLDTIPNAGGEGAAGSYGGHETDDNARPLPYHGFLLTEKAKLAMARQMEDGVPLLAASESGPKNGPLKQASESGKTMAAAADAQAAGGNWRQRQRPYEVRGVTVHEGEPKEYASRGIIPVQPQLEWTGLPRGEYLINYRQIAEKRRRNAQEGYTDLGGMSDPERVKSTVKYVMDEPALAIEGPTHSLQLVRLNDDYDSLVAVGMQHGQEGRMRITTAFNPSREQLLNRLESTLHQKGADAVRWPRDLDIVNEVVALFDQVRGRARDLDAYKKVRARALADQAALAQAPAKPDMLLAAGEQRDWSKLWPKVRELAASGKSIRAVAKELGTSEQNLHNAHKRSIRDGGEPIQFRDGRLDNEGLARALPDHHEDRFSVREGMETEPEDLDVYRARAEQVAGEEADLREPRDELLAAAERASDLNELGLYSKAQRTIERGKRKQGNAQAWLNDLKNAGVKKIELEHMGVAAFLHSQGEGAIIKAEDLAAHMRSNRLQIIRTTFGGKTFEQWVRDQGLEINEMTAGQRESMRGLFESRIGPTQARWTQATHEPFNESNTENVYSLPGPATHLPELKGDVDRTGRLLDRAVEMLVANWPAEEQREALTPVGPFYREARAKKALDLMKKRIDGGEQGSQADIELLGMIAEASRLHSKANDLFYQARQHAAEDAYFQVHYSEIPNVAVHTRTALHFTDIGDIDDVTSRAMDVAGVDHWNKLRPEHAEAAVAAGVLAPEEAAFLSRWFDFQNKYTGPDTIDPRRVHFIEEWQSDAVMEGRKKGGFRNDVTFAEKRAAVMQTERELRDITASAKAYLEAKGYDFEFAQVPHLDEAETYLDLMGRTPSATERVMDQNAVLHALETSRQNITPLALEMRPDVVRFHDEIKRLMEKRGQRVNDVIAETRKPIGNVLVADESTLNHLTARLLIQEAIDAKAKWMGITPSRIQYERYQREVRTHIADVYRAPGEAEGYHQIWMRGTDGSIVADLIVDPQGKIVKYADAAKMGDNWNAIRKLIETDGKFREGASLADILGEANARRVLGGGEGLVAHFPEGLRVGNSGMEKAYDEAYVKAILKELQKHDPASKMVMRQMRSSTTGQRFLNTGPIHIKSDEVQNLINYARLGREPAEAAAFLREDLAHTDNEDLRADLLAAIYAMDRRANLAPAEYPMFEITDKARASISREGQEMLAASEKGKGGPDKPGVGVEEGNKHSVEPNLRVRAPADAEMPAVTGRNKGLFVQDTKVANAERQVASLDHMAQKFPDPARSSEDWVRMLAYALGSDDVPVPPYAFIRDLAGGMKGAIAKIKSLSKGQIAMANQGFEEATRARLAYISGQRKVEDTGRLFAWSFLSRGVSPYTQESLFIDAFHGLTDWINKAARGEFTEADLPAYKAWKEKVAPQGSGQPGAGASHNLGGFGRDFLLKMGQRGEDGLTHLQRLHNMMSDPKMTGRQIRREFMKFAEGVGIDNKVLSFSLLVSGFDDVMVLDRVQIKALWDDGRFAERNLYDGQKTKKVIDGKEKNVMIPGTSLSEITYGARGLMIYEAIERALTKRIDTVYRQAGRPQHASIGRYHWETWVAESGQEASHGTIQAISRAAEGHNAPLAGVTAMEGEYGTFAYGARYGRDENGTPYFLYDDSRGNTYKFGIPEWRAFLAEISSSRNSAMIPKRSAFKVKESTNAPWFTRPEVNRQALDAQIERFGEPSAGAGPGDAAEGGAAGGGHGGVVPQPEPAPATRRSQRAGRGAQRLERERAPAAPVEPKQITPPLRGREEQPPLSLEEILSRQLRDELPATGYPGIAKITNKFLAGESEHSVPEHVVQQHLSIAKEIAPLLAPHGWDVGVPIGIERVGDFSAASESGDVRIYFQLAGSGEVFSWKAPWSSIRRSRAVALTVDNVVLSFRFDLSRNFGHTLRGELYHETVHALHLGGAISDELRGLLLGHARDLRVMDMTLDEYRRKTDQREMVGRPGGDMTLKEFYEENYAEHNAAKRQLFMESEEMAHLAELIYHKAIPVEKVMAILPFLEQHLGADFTQRARAIDFGRELMFAGPYADTADHIQLVNAQQLEQHGYSDTAIYEATGWFRGRDGEWAYTLPKEALQMKNMRLAGGEVVGPAKTHLKAPDMFQAYPELLDVYLYMKKRKGEPRSALSPPEPGHPEGSIEAWAATAKDMRNEIIGQMQRRMSHYEDREPDGMRPRLFDVIQDAVRDIDNKAASLYEQIHLMEKGVLEPRGLEAMKIHLYTLGQIRRDIEHSSWIAADKIRRMAKEDKLYAAGEKGKKPPHEEDYHLYDEDADHSDDYEQAAWEHMSESTYAGELGKERNEQARALSHDILDEGEHPLIRAIVKRETELAKGGANAAQIAAALNAEFKIGVTAEQISKRGAWFHIGEEIRPTAQVSPENRMKNKYSAPQRAAIENALRERVKTRREFKLVAEDLEKEIGVKVPIGYLRDISTRQMNLARISPTRWQPERIASLKKLVAERSKNWFSMAELTKRFNSEHGTDYTLSSIQRAMAANGIKNEKFPPRHAAAKLPPAARDYLTQRLHDRANSVYGTVSVTDIIKEMKTLYGVKISDSAIDAEILRLNLTPIRGKRKFDPKDHAGNTQAAVQSMTPAELGAALRENEQKVKTSTYHAPEVREWVVEQREKEKRSFSDIAGELPYKFPGQTATAFMVRNIYNRRHAPQLHNALTPQQTQFIVDMIRAGKEMPEIRDAVQDEFGIDISRTKNKNLASAYYRLAKNYRNKPAVVPDTTRGGTGVSNAARMYALERMRVIEDGDIIPARKIQKEIEEKFGEKWRISPEAAAEMDANRRSEMAAQLTARPARERAPGQPIEPPAPVPRRIPDDVRELVNGIIDDMFNNPERNITMPLIANEVELQKGFKLAQKEIEAMVVKRFNETDKDTLSAAAERVTSDPKAPEEASLLVQSCKAG